MVYREKSLVGAISSASVSGEMSVSQSMSGILNKAASVYEKDYEKLNNKPRINGVELVQDKSFEDLGDNILSNFEILELMKMAGF